MWEFILGAAVLAVGVMIGFAIGGSGMHEKPKDVDLS